MTSRAPNKWLLLHMLVITCITTNFSISILAVLTLFFFHVDLKSTFLISEDFSLILCPTVVLAVLNLEEW